MDKSYMNEFPLIHILPQERWHGDAAIIGNEKGLAMLRDLLEAAINGSGAVSSGNVSGSIGVFCNDGERYALTVALRRDMSDVPLGYADEIAKDKTPYPEWLHEAMREVADET